ncbi:MAG: hypothetical protein RLZ98_2349 [Pseudomonadota bacterium]
MTVTSSQLVGRMLGQARPRAESFWLDNGLQVVVMPYPGRPSVSHAIWYRVGSADDPPGKTGVAHLLEHLLDKATCPVNGLGRRLEFSKTVECLGAVEDAFTEFDATAYHQRISPEHLETVMVLEADRMVNLVLTEEQVVTERDVVLEERLEAIDSDPYELLYEQVNALLFLAHPYSTQVDGWEHNIRSLTRDDLMTFYRQHYAPNNAVVMVAGGVTVDEVRRLAEGIYGRLSARPEVGRRQRGGEPVHVAARQAVLEDERAAGQMMLREYLVPSYATAAPGVAEALDLLVYILAESDNSHLYRRLVVEDEIAAEVEGRYSRYHIGPGRLIFDLVAEDGESISDVAKAFDEVVRRFKADGPQQEELERAKVSFISELIWRSDNAERLSRLYGRRLIGGETLAAIEAWPHRIAAVTAEDVRMAAALYLDLRSSATGFLLPQGKGLSIAA